MYFWMIFWISSLPPVTNAKWQKPREFCFRMRCGPERGGRKFLSLTVGVSPGFLFGEDMQTYNNMWL